MKTYLPKEKDFEQKTYVVDAAGQTLGRLATRLAGLLIGKGKACFAYDQLCGDQVFVLNASQIHVTGNKASQKVYTHYTGYPGGLRSQSFERVRERKPEEILVRAVSRMLPKNKLGSKMLKRLRVFAGTKHPHQAQKAVPLKV